MRLKAIDFVFLGLAASAGPFVIAERADAQSYPSQQIRLIVPFAAGGITDLLARMAGDHIRTKTGQSVVVENRPGAGGNTGLDQVVKSTPDGYTIGLCGATMFGVNPHIFKQMPFDPMRDLVPVATIAEAPQILVVNAAKVPASTLQEFIAYAKANPTKLNYGSAGTGTPNHLGADQITRQAGISVAHVPYRGGGPAVADLVAGNVEVAVIATGLVIEHVKAGTLKVLAAVAPKRLPFLPDVPTTGEGGLPTYDTANWFGIVAPAKTPAAVVGDLNRVLTSMADDKAILDRIERAYMLPFRVSPDEFAAMVKADNPKWEKVVREAGIKPE
jgi:tripartite-type tricarboxylate transporter receptor subunit TctC